MFRRARCQGCQSRNSYGESRDCRACVPEADAACRVTVEQCIQSFRVRGRFRLAGDFAVMLRLSNKFVKDEKTVGVQQTEPAEMAGDPELLRSRRQKEK